MSKLRLVKPGEIPGFDIKASCYVMDKGRLDILKTKVNINYADVTEMSSNGESWFAVPVKLIEKYV